MAGCRSLAAVRLCRPRRCRRTRQALRPEVGKPLQQAGDLLKAGKAKEALAKVARGRAVPEPDAGTRT